jgi:hypothetical protein
MSFDNQVILPTGTGLPGAAHSEPLFVDWLQFDGDDDYPAGGTPAFEVFYRALIEQSRTIACVIGQDCGGYVVTYDRENDKLKVWEQTDVATSPLIETVTSDLSGTTFNVVVISY